ncbi:TolB family protein [Aquimarina algicola]|uniref:TolB protein n=1 Tax=Aquimarina algicola TaxID=2589995 RepID=A0A504JME8_9FLAO|nr:PD40 domain-containing protein [Aquimarina algicola]TPN88948.1 hypothetical protein FHK87_01650 [Aquimarina algicola]
MNTLKQIFPAALIIVVLFLCACSNDSRSTSEDLDANSNLLNPGITGKLFVHENDYGSYLLDLASGIFTEIPNTDWENQNDRFPSGVANFWAIPAKYDHQEFIIKVRNCKRVNDDVLSPSLTCIAIQNYKGEYVSQFELLYAVRGSVHLSRNREYLALFRNIGQSVSSDKWLEIYDREGNLISDQKLDETSIDWLPNGRLVYIQNRSFIFTEPYSTTPDYQLTLPEMISGSPGQISVSPDGTRVAFSMIHTSNFATTRATPYVMNSDGTNIKQLADVPGEEFPIINSPTWSPDSKWILLKEGGAQGQDLNTPGVLGHLYAIPSDLDKVVMLSSIDDEKSPEAIRLKRYYKDTEPNEEKPNPTDRFPNWGLYWLPN